MILGSGVPHDTKGIVSAEINGGSEVVRDPWRCVNSDSVGPGLEDLAIGPPGYCISGELEGLEDLSIVPGCTISEAMGLSELIIVPGYAAAISG